MDESLTPIVVHVTVQTTKSMWFEVGVELNYGTYFQYNEKS